MNGKIMNWIRAFHSLKYLLLNEKAFVLAVLIQKTKIWMYLLDEAQK